MSALLTAFILRRVSQNLKLQHSSILIQKSVLTVVPVSLHVQSPLFSKSLQLQMNGGNTSRSMQTSSSDKPRYLNKVATLVVAMEQSLYQIIFCQKNNR